MRHYAASTLVAISSGYPRVQLKREKLSGGAIGGMTEGGNNPPLWSKHDPHVSSRN